MKLPSFIIAIALSVIFTLVGIVYANIERRVVAVETDHRTLSEKITIMNDNINKLCWKQGVECQK